MRTSGPSRYRHWLTHKLSSWHDQFGDVGLRGLRTLYRLVPHRNRHHRRDGSVRANTEEKAAFEAERAERDDD